MSTLQWQTAKHHPIRVSVLLIHLHYNIVILSSILLIKSKFELAPSFNNMTATFYLNQNIIPLIFNL